MEFSFNGTMEELRELSIFLYKKEEMTETSEVQNVTQPEPIIVEDTPKLPNGDAPEDYTIFQDMADAANKLKEKYPEVYEEVLSKYVPEGKKYSAIHAKDWGKATKDFIKAMKQAKKTKTKDVSVSDDKEEITINMIKDKVVAFVKKDKQKNHQIIDELLSEFNVENVSKLEQKDFSAFYERLLTLEVGS